MPLTKYLTLQEEQAHSHDSIHQTQAAPSCNCVQPNMTQYYVSGCSKKKVTS